MIATSKPGRPEKVATAEQKELIRELASRRVPLKLVAKVCGCCENTLKKHHGDLIEVGHAEADAAIFKKFFEMALAGDTKMIRMYLMWHCEFREPPREVIAAIDPEKLAADIEEARRATYIDPPEQTEE